MEVEFVKYQGTGNDFILIDDRRNTFDIDDSDLIAALCERRMGIGADGLILLRNHDAADFEMLYFNADGKQSSMCGNGGRCIVTFANIIGLIGDDCTFMAVDGLHKAKIVDGRVMLQMQLVKVDRKEEVFLIDTGSPHYITFVDDVDSVNVKEEGSFIRNSPEFKKEGINVNFVELSPVTRVRTFERGVENETLSCGTGAVAVAVAVDQLKNIVERNLEIETLGGCLTVSFDKIGDADYRDIWLAGSVDLVYIGEFTC